MNKKHIILILIFGLLAYGNTLFNSFVSDDDFIITKNVFIKSINNLPRIFDKSYITKTSDVFLKSHRNQDVGSGELSYRPVSTLTHFFEYAIWKLNAFGYHLTNLIMHLANSILLYLLIFLVLKDAKLAFWAGVFFSVHPISAEAINVITYREDLLIVFFILLSFIAFIRHKEQHDFKRPLFYYLSILSFGLALFSKEMAISFPVLIILYDYYFEFEGNIKKVLINLKSRYLGFIIAAIMYLYINFVVFANPDKTAISYPGGSFYTNLLTMSVAFSEYISSFWFPLIIKPLPTRYAPIMNTFINREVILSISLIIVFIILALRTYNKSKAASFFMFWFFITLIPVSNIFPLTNPMAYRYVYLPSIGFCVVLAILCKSMSNARLLARVSPFFYRKIIISIAALFIILSFSLNCFYKDSFVLAKEILRYYPSNQSATNQIAFEYYSRKDYVKAMVYFKSSIRYDPRNPLLHNSLGSCYEALGKYDEAIGEFMTAIKLRPDFVSGYYNLGIIYAKKKKYDMALSYYQKAKKLDPGFLNCYRDIAKIYLTNKKYRKAASVLLEGLEVAPDDKELKDLLAKAKKS